MFSSPHGWVLRTQKLRPHLLSNQIVSSVMPKLGQNVALLASPAAWKFVVLLKKISFLVHSISYFPSSSPNVKRDRLQARLLLVDGEILFHVQIISIRV